MSNLIFVLTLSLLTVYSVFAKQYSCQKCVSNGKNCVGTEKVSNCDYCVKIDGTIYDAAKVPDMAKTYLKDNHPNFKGVKNNEHIVGRGCITKQLLKSLGFEDGADCVRIDKNDNTGFVGYACTCLGNC